MTVKELKAALDAFPDDMVVIVASRVSEDNCTPMRIVFAKEQFDDGAINHKVPDADEYLLIA